MTDGSTENRLQSVQLTNKGKNKTNTLKMTVPTILYRHNE